MSLKAKIEAVIYASEEPVTLAQLVGLLGHEAQAELDHFEAAQQSLGLEEAEGDSETLNSEVLSDEERAESLDQALHEAAAEEAAAARLARHHAEADAAAMSSADGTEAPVEAEAVPEAEQGSAAPTEAVRDEKKLAREAKEKERRLRDYFRSILDQLIGDYATGDRGLEIREVASGYRLATKPEYHDAVRGFVKSLKPPLKLSLQALETLAVVAYKQPVTAPEISEIRGVDSGGVLGSLMARKLVTTAGRKQVIGRPILYKTTRDFLLRFGLKDINELPSIEEFEKMAGELAEQEEIPMNHNAPESPNDVEQEKDAVEPQADGDSSPLNSVPVGDHVSGPPPADQQTENVGGEADSPALDAQLQQDKQQNEPPDSQEEK
jgi:segregation and condensation protein B